MHACTRDHRPATTTSSTPFNAHALPCPARSCILRSDLLLGENGVNGRSSAATKACVQVRYPLPSVPTDRSPAPPSPAPPPPLNSECVWALPRRHACMHASVAGVSIRFPTRPYCV